ncbi:DUF1501 domain-containing protein [Vibrio paucivorans]
MNESKYDIGRRSFLKSVAAVGACSALPNLAFAKTDSSNLLVWITLRGAMDGLNVVVPYSDPDYLPSRPTIGLKQSQLNKLDGMFGLHPNLKHAYDWFNSNELAIVHAVATPYRQRSHFDGQKVLENGTSDPMHREGWLNRLLLTNSQSKGIAIDAGLPLIMQGDESVSSWYPNNLKVRDRQAQLLEELFQSDQALSENFMEAMEIEKMAGEAMTGRQFSALASQAGKFLTAENGPNIAVLELGGWDTHAGQGSVAGRLPNQLKKLDQGLAALKKALGPQWQKTAIVIASEFGRTVKENGTQGTDHGTANAVFIAGGAVSGGKVIADWPGLSESQLYQGRDLAPTADMQTVIKGVLRDHLGVSESKLDSIFPENDEKGMAGLIKV